MGNAPATQIVLIGISNFCNDYKKDTKGNKNGKSLVFRLFLFLIVSR